jgi:hypothetical protein
MRSLRRRLSLSATFGQGFRPTEVADQYKIKIYVGAGPDMKKIDARAAAEAERFRQIQGYGSFTQVKRRYWFLPSYYEYTFQFGRD